LQHFTMNIWVTIRVLEDMLRMMYMNLRWHKPLWIGSF
ncbi:MAG: hypothetical protein ACI8RA_002741, partial [Chlamydiales bacterium]